nr:integrase, catalytic region, zinc finger, CCHC-type, peptidase aspartic, catalytic [Tanacetum cinerariifolium]
MKPRKSKTSVPVSKPLIIKSISANNKEPSKSWGSIVSNVPSSSVDECRNVMISSVYYVEGLGHNLFFVGLFYDSNIEVAFCQHTYFIRYLKGDDLLTGSRGNNLYTLSLRDMMASSPICLLSKASKTKSWLWHRHLSHFNFGAINHLARHGPVRGLPKLKLERTIFVLLVQWEKARRNPTNQNLKTPIEKNYISCTWIFVAQCVSQVLMERSTSSSLSMITLDLRGVDLPAPEVISPIDDVVAPEPAESTSSPSSTAVDQDEPSASNYQTSTETQSPVISNDVEEGNHDLDIAHMINDPFIGILIPENNSKSSSSDVIPTIVHTSAPNLEHVNK